MNLITVLSVFLTVP